MNRNMTDVYSLLLHPTQQGEVFHRYILGLYDFLERLTAAHPTILFEGCSGGVVVLMQVSCITCRRYGRVIIPMR